MVYFVRFNLGSGQAGKHGNVACAGAWFEHVHAGLKGGGFHHDKSLRGRRAKLLEVYLALVAS